MSYSFREHKTTPFMMKGVLILHEEVACGQTGAHW